MIAPQYFNKEQTPLKYYHFLRVILIFVVIARIVQGAQLLRSAPDAYSIFYAVAGLLLTIAAAAGMNSLKWYGVLALFGIWGLSILDSIVALVIIHTYQLTYPSISTTIGQIISCGIAAVLNWIYFMKRRLLFSPMPKNVQPMQIDAERTVVPDSPPVEIPTPAAPPLLPELRLFALRRVHILHQLRNICRKSAADISLNRTSNARRFPGGRFVCALVYFA